MPSNTVTNTTAFKGSDYTDSPGNRMVRNMRNIGLRDFSTLLLVGSFSHVLAF